MFGSIAEITKTALSNIVSKVVVNTYFSTKSFFTGEAKPAEALTNFSTETAKDILFETTKVSLNCAADLVPGGALTKGAAHVVADMAAKGIQAGFESQDVTKTMLKTGFYALNATLSVPLGPIGGVVAYGAGYATDYVVDIGAEKIDFAYSNYKNARDYRKLEDDKTSSLMQTEIREDEMSVSFMLIAPAA